MFAIYKRELKSYFTSFIGFLFIAVTLAFIGLYFTVYNLINASPYFAYVLNGVAFLFLISVPILTMKVFADERRNKTDQLILTAPVSVGGIVVGKYLATLTVFIIPVAISCVYPIIMSLFGSVPLGEAYLAILGYFFFGATAIAIGLFISALTESQVIAAVLGFAVLFLGYMMSSICSLFSSLTILTKILGCFDLYTHFSEMLNGVLNTTSIIYYVSMIAFVLFLTGESIQKRRYSVSSKHLSFGAYSSGMIVVALAIVVVLNIIVGEIPASFTAVDVTSEKLYSLTDQTKEFLDTVDEEVTIYVLVDESSQDSVLKQTLDRYAGLNKNITLKYINPTSNPMFASKYTSDSITNNSLIVESAKRYKVINYADIYTQSYDQSTGTLNTSGYDGEGQLTSAIDYVISDDMPKVYILEGHGETALSSSFSNAISKENVDYEDLNLLNSDSIPEDACGLIINAPTSDFSSDDADKIISFLENGGNVIMVTSWSEEEMPNITKVLDYMGLAIQEGIVVDNGTNMSYMSPYYLLPEVIDNDFTDGIYGSQYIFAPLSQGIIVKDETASDLTYTRIIASSEDSFSKVNIDSLDETEMADEDVAGPFILGLSAKKTISDSVTAKLALFASAQIFTDTTNQMVSGANLTLFTNVLSNYVNREVSISIPVKSYNVSYLTVPQTMIVLIGAITTIILPVLLLITGFVIWLVRRTR